MTERQRATPPANAARIAVAGVIIAGGALAMAGQAGADPAVPLPDADAIGSGCGCPGSRPARGGVCRWTGGSASAATRRRATGARDPEPRLRPGQTPGQLGYLRDIWHTFHSGNPLDALTAPPEVAPGPPPGAGPAPQLPPGYISLNAPESNGPPPAGPAQGGPPLPPGYYPLNGPPPPGYYDGPHTGPDPAAPLAVTVTPVPGRRLNPLGCVVSQRL